MIAPRGTWLYQWEQYLFIPVEFPRSSSVMWKFRCFYLTCFFCAVETHFKNSSIYLIAVCLGKADLTEIVSPTRYATAPFLYSITLCKLFDSIISCKLLKLNSPVKITGKKVVWVGSLKGSIGAFWVLALNILLVDTSHWCKARRPYCSINFYKLFCNTLNETHMRPVFSFI